MLPRTQEAAGKLAATQGAQAEPIAALQASDGNGRRARYCGTRVRCERAFGGVATPTVWPPAYAPYLYTP